MNIRIVRLFTKMREALHVHKELLKRIEALEKTTSVHNVQLHHIFVVLKELIQRDSIRVRTKAIGFNKKRDHNT